MRSEVKIQKYAIAVATSLALTAMAAGNSRAIETVAQFTKHRPGNPAITSDGRILVSMHPLDKPEFKVLEVMKNGGTKPFPNEKVARDELKAVIGIRAAANGIVWILDMGAAASGPKLIGWDTKKNELAKTIPIPASVTRSNSFLQDFALDQKRNLAYIADMTRGDMVGASNPAIVIVDLTSGSARRVLENHPTFSAEALPIVIDGKPLSVKTPNGKRATISLGLNPITIDPRHDWVYWGTINGRSIHRVRSADLANPDLPEKALSVRIEHYGAKAPSDGISVDSAGNVYISDIANNAIGVTKRGGSYEVLIKDDRRLSWPDGFAFGPDGYLYVTVDQLHRHSTFNDGVEQGQPPYSLVRVRPLASSDIGR